MFKLKPRLQLSMLNPKSRVQLGVDALIIREFNMDDRVLIKSFIK